MKFELHAAKAEIKLLDYPDNSIDSCVHDGPYGIRFMGKAWDGKNIEDTFKRRNEFAKNEEVREGRTSNGFGKSLFAGTYNQANQANQAFQFWTTEIAREVYRVLKPGAYFLSFCSPRTFHRLVCGIEDAGFEIRDTLMWIFGSGFPKSHNLKGDWKGWGSALKPAFEPICMARKPLEKGLTIEENVKKWGTGAIYIDGCRVEGDPWVWGSQTNIKGGNYGHRATDFFTRGEAYAENVKGGENGRWPANIMHDGSEEVVALFPESYGQQGDVKGTEPSNTGMEGTHCFGKFNRVASRPKRNDSGSAARFFYVPKTSRADRNEGCESLNNNHPTVKPTEAMQYLVRLVTPPGGTCLDHMCGSGSTGKACAIEDFDFIGIDEDPHNIEISRLRIQFILDHKNLFGTFIRPK